MDGGHKIQELTQTLRSKSDIMVTFRVTRVLCGRDGVGMKIMYIKKMNNFQLKNKKK